MKKWFIEWSSATARGNTVYFAPENWNRIRVWKTWESAHAGCYVERLISAGSEARP